MDVFTWSVDVFFQKKKEVGELERIGKERKEKGKMKWRKNKRRKRARKNKEERKRESVNKNRERRNVGSRHWASSFCRVQPRRHWKYPRVEHVTPAAKFERDSFIWGNFTAVFSFIYVCIFSFFVRALVGYIHILYNSLDFSILTVLCNHHHNLP